MLCRKRELQKMSVRLVSCGCALSSINHSAESASLGGANCHWTTCVCLLPIVYKLRFARKIPGVYLVHLPLSLSPQGISVCVCGGTYGCAALMGGFVKMFAPIVGAFCHPSTYYGYLFGNVTLIWSTKWPFSFEMSRLLPIMDFILQILHLWWMLFVIRCRWRFFLLF